MNPSLEKQNKCLNFFFKSKSILVKKKNFERKKIPKRCIGFRSTVGATSTDMKWEIECSEAERPQR